MQKLRENAGRMHDFWCVMRRVAIQFFGCVVAIFASGRTVSAVVSNTNLGSRNVNYGNTFCMGRDVHYTVDNPDVFNLLDKPCALSYKDITTNTTRIYATGNIRYCVPAWGDKNEIKDQ